MPLISLILLLFAGTVSAEGEQCPVVEDPAAGGPICRYSENPLADIERVFQPLWKASGYGTKVKLFYMESVHDPNAVAIGPNVPPNKENIPKIAVSAGLWDLAQSDDEMAFVLAHEMSHLANLDGEHLVETLPKLVDPWMSSARGKKIQEEIYARTDLTEEEKTSEVVRRFQQLVINPRKTVIEQMADVNALNLMAITDGNGDGRPDYNIDAAISFLNRVREYHPEHDAIDLNSDHPSVSERLRQAEGIRIFQVGAAYFPHGDASGTTTLAGDRREKGLKRMDVGKAGRRLAR